MNNPPAFPMSNTEAAMYASCLEDLGNPNLDKAEQAHLSAKANALCGMTLRDYMAAKALQNFRDQIGSQSDQEWFDLMAEGAYRMADAMLKARQT